MGSDDESSLSSDSSEEFSTNDEGDILMADDGNDASAQRLTPPGFARVTTNANKLVLSTEGAGRELWLIRMPKATDISALHGQRLILPDGDETITSTKGRNGLLALQDAGSAAVDQFVTLAPDGRGSLKQGQTFSKLVVVSEVRAEHPIATSFQSNVTPIVKETGLSVRFRPPGSSSGPIGGAAARVQAKKGNDKPPKGGKSRKEKKAKKGKRRSSSAGNMDSPKKKKKQKKAAKPE